MKKLVSLIFSVLLFFVLVESSAFAASTKPIYSLTHTGVFDQLYTVDSNEANILMRAGWHRSIDSWNAPINEGEPVYRLYNPSSQRHLYTLDLNEVSVLTSQHGWVSDNNGEPVFYSSGPKPVYRVYNYRYGMHIFTTDPDAERTYQYQGGWSFEGVKLYGY